MAKRAFKISCSGRSAQAAQTTSKRYTAENGLNSGASTGLIENRKNTPEQFAGAGKSDITSLRAKFFK